MAGWTFVSPAQRRGREGAAMNSRNPLSHGRVAVKRRGVSDEPWRELFTRAA